MREHGYGNDTEGRQNGRMRQRGKRKVKHPFIASILASILLGMACLFFMLRGAGPLETLAAIVPFGILAGLFFIYPWVLTATEVCLTVTDWIRRDAGREERYRKGLVFDVITVPLGVIYTALYLSVKDVVTDADWDQVLYNSQIHTPIHTQSLQTILVVALVGYVGYLTVSCFVSLKNSPPLVPVLGMAAMYLGTAESILWGVQVCSPESLTGMDIYLALLPVNCVLITARTVRYKVWEWRQMPHEDPGTGSLWKNCNSLLMRSGRWPFAAFLLMWPFLGILTALLFLTGQRPDAIIRAFTETADWNLSRRTAPQNVMYDEHYLCTVAAGGHRRIVKPLRLGVRHGHEVIVNRQLCVANAFEQLLEERSPRFHRAVRHFYDTYGFPVAKRIRSRYAADLVYFLMKPLEWLFLITLYLADEKPENRIALQYTGKSLRDFRNGELKAEEAE